MEYLIVHPAEKLVERFVLVEGRYSAEQVFGSGEILPLSLFPDLQIKVGELFGEEHSQ